MVIFVAIALAVSGVAIWLLFGALSNSAGGGITVAEVAMSPLSFSSLQIDGQDVKDGQTVGAGFIFDTAEGDNDGRVVWNGRESEKMSINVTGVIQNAQYLSKFTYSLALPEGVIKAAEKGYVDISQFYDLEKGVLKTVEVSLTEGGTMMNDGANAVWYFNFEIALKWGSAFGGMNPSIYYDTLGIGVPLEDVVATLNDMRTTILGESNNTPSYLLTLTASPNS